MTTSQEISSHTSRGSKHDHGSFSAFGFVKPREDKNLFDKYKGVAENNWRGDFYRFFPDITLENRTLYIAACEYVQSLLDKQEKEIREEKLEQILYFLRLLRDIMDEDGVKPGENFERLRLELTTLIKDLTNNNE